MGRIPGVYIKNLPGDIDRHSILETFQHTWGDSVQVLDVKIIRHNYGQDATALVDLQDQQAADQVWDGGRASLLLLLLISMLWLVLGCHSPNPFCKATIS